MFQGSTFWYQPVWCPCSCAQPEVTMLHLGGDLVPIEALHDMHCYMPPLWRKQDSGPLLHYCCFPHVLTNLNSYCLNMSFGIQERSRRMKIFFLQKGNWELEMAFVPGRAPQGPSGFQSLFSLIILNFVGNRCWTRKGMTFWIKMLIINSAEELGFMRTLYQHDKINGHGQINRYSESIILNFNRMSFNIGILLSKNLLLIILQSLWLLR